MENKSKDYKMGQGLIAHIQNNGNIVDTYNPSNFTQQDLERMMDEIRASTAFKEHLAEMERKLWFADWEYEEKPMSKRQINKLNKGLNKLYKDLDNLTNEI